MHIVYLYLYAYSCLCILQAMLLFWWNLHIPFVYIGVCEMLNSYLVLWGESNKNSHWFMLSHMYLHIVFPWKMTAHAVLLCHGHWGSRFCLGPRHLTETLILLHNFSYFIHGSHVRSICQASVTQKDTKSTQHTYASMDRLFYIIMSNFMMSGQASFK